MANANSDLSADKKIVQDGYDKMAEKYDDWTREEPRFRKHYTEILIKNLPANATVLEIGCGAGAPVLEMFANSGAKVLANDISTAMIELAKKRCPDATFMPGDMTALDIAPSSLHAVAAFFSIIHLPREEQPGMLSKIHGWLADGGMTAFTLACMDASEIRSTFFGQDMFWSSFDVKSSKAMVQAAGFQILEAEVLEDGKDRDPDDPDHGVQFLWILAKKPEAVA
ncbi:hypothetical protein PRZ48_009991 [Zasmidium cellare]|uniref:Methyltransferase domain-containing protein n=1 Tax=Zasmidium cellare TaxID=395010 RepID=A0ABR0EDZ1_ZASCE|nr:hypothetical protein PRZ48_009991 [Zasmidium cellare]